MKIAVLEADRVGSTIGRLWHASHDVTFTARHPAAGTWRCAHAAPVADAAAAVEAMLVAVPGRRSAS